MLVSVACIACLGTGGVTRLYCRLDKNICNIASRQSPLPQTRKLNPKLTKYANERKNGCARTKDALRRSRARTYTTRTRAHAACCRCCCRCCCCRCRCCSGCNCYRRRCLPASAAAATTGCCLLLLRLPLSLATQCQLILQANYCLWPRLLMPRCWIAAASDRGSLCRGRCGAPTLRKDNSNYRACLTGVTISNLLSHPAVVSIRMRDTTVREPFVL